MTRKLADEGWAVIQTGLDDRAMSALRETAFAENAAGQRCLLDQPEVAAVAVRIRAGLSAAGFLAPSAVAIQAIAFDKTPGTNWKVTWHQDVMFPFARPVSARGYDLPAKKEGVDYARPPRSVLEDLLAVRLHLDLCDEANGPLRVSPKSHRSGVLKSMEIPISVARCGEQTVLAGVGEALLMKPLLLHASSPATAPAHRRVLHLVFHSGAPVAETWHRSL